MNLNEIAIIGAGNGGRAFASYLSSKGYKVNLVFRTLEKIKSMHKTRKIQSQGEIKGTFKLNMVTNDVGKALENAFLILIVVPASAHENIIKQILPFLHDYQVILLNPGRTWGAIHVKNIISKERPELYIHVGETQTLLFTCRAIEDKGVMIYKIKESVQYCFYPEEDNMYVEKTFAKLFPQLVPINDIRITSLSNIGAILHPATTILNAGAITRKKPFLFYREGVTKEIARVIKKVDEERCRILEGLGLPTNSFIEWARDVYNCDCEDYADAFKKIPYYESIWAPTTLNQRYLFEEIPTGLVALSSLGVYLGIPTPTIDSLITLASVLLENDFKTNGRTIENVGVPDSVLLHEHVKDTDYALIDHFNESADES
ncbi:MAG: NAD/NADP octopine/nopaline dehydrogenase family protein [Promethearchaeota archaeon]